MRRHAMALALGFMFGTTMDLLVSSYKISRTIADAITHVVLPDGAPRRPVAIARALMLCEIDLEAETERADFMAATVITDATIEACLRFHPHTLRPAP